MKRVDLNSSKLSHDQTQKRFIKPGFLESEREYDYSKVFATDYKEF